MDSSDLISSKNALNTSAANWTWLTDEIKERQDVKCLSTLKKTAPGKSLTKNTESDLRLCVEDDIVQRLRLLLAQDKPDFLSSFFLSAWHLLLHAYCYSAQTLVGFLGPSCEYSFLPSLVNHYHESVPTFKGVMSRVQGDLTKSRAHRAAFDTSPELELKWKFLPDNVFVHCDNVSSFELNWAAALSVPVAMMSLITPESLQFRLAYASEEFQQQDIAQLLTTFIHVLRQVSVNPDIKLRELRFISSEERRLILSKGLTLQIPLQKTMLTLFEEQVARVPNNVAVICEGRQLRYAELNSRANQLAQLILSTVEIKEDSILALSLVQSELIELSILAVWKAGAAYVAIDPTFPAERKSYILGDTAALLVLTDAESILDIQKLCGDRAVLNVESTDLSSLPTSKPKGFPTNGDSLSHVVYTSGTTGKPKGVLTLHRALVNHCLDYPERYDLSNDEVIPLIFNYVFNAFSEPLTLALGNGFPLLVVRKSLLLEKEKLHDYMAAQKVTHIDATPSLLTRLDLSRIKTLRRVAPGGEQLSPEVYSKIKNAAPAVKIYNVFGNSEGTLCTMTSLLDTYENAFQRQVLNKQCLVVSSNLSLLPVNAIGELCLSGIGVARGYLNNDDLTRARFLDNPYQTEQSYNSKLFCTGDLGRRLPSGAIEYLGRKDLQIKIRGFRVELGEIESAIRDFPGVTESAVTASTGPRSEEIMLTAFYVQETNSGSEEIRAYLRRFLPDYMIPTKLIRLPEMPLTTNGKIDRLLLATVPVNASKAAVQEVEDRPEDKLTERIRRIWEESLGVLPLSFDVNADFFDLGGNSLIAMALGERMSTELGVSIDAAFLYNNSTVAEFAESLRSVVKDEHLLGTLSPTVHSSQ